MLHLVQGISFGIALIAMVTALFWLGQRLVEHCALNELDKCAEEDVTTRRDYYKKMKSDTSTLTFVVFGEYVGGTLLAAAVGRESDAQLLLIVMLSMVAVSCLLERFERPLKQSRRHK